jgi:acetyl-CoA synthetase
MDRYRETYWADYGRYFAGDGARRDRDGYYWLLGRFDDVMNIAGHRISTTEVESALVDHPAVAEAAVVGKATLTGQAIFAYVILKTGRGRATLALERATTSPRVIRPIARPKDRCSPRTCPRHAPARSYGACCATWPRPQPGRYDDPGRRRRGRNHP